jgi:nucleotide-binding universal stress UspA family protein
MASRVVIGYDGSEASEDAVAFGLTWCRSTGDVPVVATVYPEEHPLGAGRVDVEWATYVREQAEIIQDKARATVGDAALYRNLASTSAAHGLADLAEDVEAAVVIVGTTQETGLTRALLGSSTERLLHGATAPVTVCRRGGGSQHRIGSPKSGWRTWTLGTAARRCGWRCGLPCESRPG